MFLKHLTVLFTLCTVSFAAVLQECFAFEKPVNGKPLGFNVTTDKEVSLLLFHMNDLKHTNIPLFTDQQILQQEPDGFKICTQKVHATGGCENIGEFAINYSDETIKENVINKVSYPGESTFFPVRQPGLACFLTYQEGVPEVTGILVREKHSYGASNLQTYGTLQTTLVACFIVFASGLYWYFKFFKKLDTLDVPHKFLSILIVISLTYYNATNGALSMFNKGHQGSRLTNFILIINEGLFNIFFYNLLYHFSLNQANIGRPRGNYGKLYSACLVAYAAKIFVDELQLLGSFPLSIHMFVFIPVQAAASFAWAPIWYVLYKNSKKTIEDIMDVIYWRSYQISRKTFFFAPLALKLVAYVSLFAISMHASWKALDGRSSVSQREYSLIFISTFSTLSQPGFMALLIHVDILTVPMIIVSQMYVWRPRVVPKLTGDVEDFLVEDEELSKRSD